MFHLRRLKFVLAAPLKYGANEAAELDDPDLPRYVRITDINESDGLRVLIRVRPSRNVASRFLVNSLNSATIRPQVEAAAKTSAGMEDHWRRRQQF